MSTLLAEGRAAWQLTVAILHTLVGRERISKEEAQQILKMAHGWLADDPTRQEHNEEAIRLLEFEARAFDDSFYEIQAVSSANGHDDDSAATELLWFKSRA
jgi:hypothetical protein